MLKFLRTELATIAAGTTQGEPDHILVQRADELKKLTPAFYIGMAMCSLVVGAVFFERMPMATAFFHVGFLTLALMRLRSWRRLDPAQCGRDRLVTELRYAEKAMIVFSLCCPIIAFTYNQAASPSEQSLIMLWVLVSIIGAAMATQALIFAQRRQPCHRDSTLRNLSGFHRRPHRPRGSGRSAW